MLTASVVLRVPPATLFYAMLPAFVVLPVLAATLFFLAVTYAMLTASVVLRVPLATFFFSTITRAIFIVFAAQPFDNKDMEQPTVYLI